MKTMTKEELDQYVDDFYPDEEILTCDGFDDCIIGICNRFGQSPIIAYDKDKMIEQLTKDMSYEEAIEHFDYNIIGAWMGDGTPCFIETPE